MERRFPTKSVVNFLSQTPLFKMCEQGDLYQVAEAAEQQRFQTGAVILKAGRPVSGLGVLLRGKASLVLSEPSGGGAKRIELMQPGSFYGETGLVLGAAYPLTVLAEEECEALVVGRQHFEALMRKYTEMSVALCRRISSRFVQLTVLCATAAPEPTPRPAAAEDKGQDGDQIIWVDLGAYNLSHDVLQMVPSQLMRKHRLLPLELTGQKLVVGMVNPKSMEAITELRRVLHSVDPEVVAISMDDFSRAFVRLKLDTDVKPGRSGAKRELPLVYAVDQEKDADNAHLYIGNEVITLLDEIIREGVEREASDIHIEPESVGVKVRYRVQGNLVERKDFLAASFAVPLVARIKVLAELDITERRQPQDGRIAAQMGKQDLSFRVSTMPVARGEKAVIRIIDSSDAMRPLGQIIVNPALDKAIRKALAEPYGAIVVAGPTGSGKSSTLYSLLAERRAVRPDNSIVTVEDPVEYLLQGVTQVQVIPRVGFGFPQALHGMMRQDPDVIMIGEVRDSTTGTIMVEAALTGHLVLCSIHGNNVLSVLQRLQHLGSNSIMLSQALSIVIVQRLAKRLCPSCAVEGEVAPALLENLVARNIIAPTGAVKLPRPVGCDACNKTGYLGRVAVQEVMNFDETIRAALANDATPEELIEVARERKRFFSFAQAASYLMTRRMLSPSDALLLVAD